MPPKYSSRPRLSGRSQLAASTRMSTTRYKRQGLSANWRRCSFGKALPRRQWQKKCGNSETSIYPVEAIPAGRAGSALHKGEYITLEESIKRRRREGGGVS